MEFVLLSRVLRVLLNLYERYRMSFFLFLQIAYPGVSKFALAFVALGQFISYILPAFTFFNAHHFFILFLLFFKQRSGPTTIRTLFISFPSFLMRFLVAIHSLSNQASCILLFSVCLILHFLAFSINRDVWLRHLNILYQE